MIGLGQGEDDDVRPGHPTADPDAAQGRDVLPAVVGHHRGHRPRQHDRLR